MISWFKAQYDELNPFGRFFFGIGCLLLLVGAAMTFKFGYSMSVLHALMLGGLSIVAAFLPEAAYRMFEDGKPALAFVIGALSVPLLGIEYFSHIGYTVGQRVENTQQTSVHNTKYDDARESLASDKANIAMWREHLDKLTAENPWAATVNPDGLKEQAATLGQTVDAERARGGCGPKCMGFMKQKAELEARIGVAEQASKLANQIEATQRIIDKKTEVASTQTFESSPVVNQTSFVAKLVALDLKPGEEVKEGSQIGISASLALAGVILTPICFLVAGRNRRREGEENAVAALSAYDANLGSVTAGTVLTPRAEPSSHTVVQVTDRSALEVLAGLKKQLERQQQTRLAAA